MSEINQDELFMERCLQLAKKGQDAAAPNPMVGSVIVCNGQIIGEGYHQKCGMAHAEVNAINSVVSKELLEKSTIYVSLEPCAHHGKTPPCADLIIGNRIPNVIIGMQDPFAKVNGEGIKKLKHAGCNVKVGILENKCAELNREFIVFHTKKRPYIILKWAQTLDGYMDRIRESGETGEPNWITNEVCRALVHKWRTEVQSIMVGTNTAIIDNPKLNVRSWVGKAPIRIVIDKQLKIPNSHHLLDGLQPTIVLNERISEIKGPTEYLKFDFGKEFLRDLNQYLFQRSITSLFIEGGQELLNTFISQSNWDEARVFTGNKYFNKGIAAPKIKGTMIVNEKLRDNNLAVYKNT
ncbi:MAG: bifunctional diaminohydroxyphosphoribosylaminopyrimidine deaminase/5-amino-6-(5-phosphoribosylamino)uracil reductase RibD [Salinivirgaceae bacterium]|jgi:diaminohydroxyphosphoribosylaminopyrimidine deaminase/5-amino-6-(5-phosphoribosylamino)uracil reductase|nr:bifunctional diaminohydroxyphosphoribosylaminopyrimidine deaminase/5-amino-6-(5-phosphoribosylamino)uracil reductase RibD [Salinivirgaceae bacterium]